MSITLELTQAEEARLREAAHARNMDLPTFAKAYLLGDLEPEETTFLRSNGDAAIGATREKLLSEGIGYVSGRDGKVLRTLPGGAEETLGIASR